MLLSRSVGDKAIVEGGFDQATGPEKDDSAGSLSITITAVEVFF